MRLSSIPLLFAAVLFTTTFLTSCAYEKSAAYDAYETPNVNYTNNQEGVYEFEEVRNTEGDLEFSKVKLSSSTVTAGFNKEMLVYNASLTLTVRNQDSTMARIEKLTLKEEGYVVSKSNYKIVVRIDTKRMNSAIETIMKEGKVDSKNISTRDVSDEYADVQIRLDNAEKARTRYLELLAKAENVEAALKVEKELERLNTEIDQLRGQLKKMEHDVRYSTITVNVYEKPKLGVLGYVFVGIGKGVKWLFVRG
jgi:hypothetical protein